MKKFPNYYSKYIISFFIVCLVCFGAGFHAGTHFQKSKNISVVKTEEHKPQTPQINAKFGARTAVSYVPKVITPNGKEKTDIEANIEHTGVTVKVNGKERVLPLIKEEKQKFEDGKIVLDQTSHVVFDVTVPDRNELKLYAEASVNDKHNGNVGIGIEKKNGKFVYGGFIDQDKSYKLYARYEILKFYSK